MADKSFLSILVAGVAIIIGAIMQYLTIRSTRRTTADTLRQTRENTRDTLTTTLITVRANIRADNLRHDVDELTEALSHYMSNSYHVDSGYRAAKMRSGTWPGEHWEEVKLEDLLYNKIRLRLTPEDPLDMELVKNLENLRDFDSKQIWAERRNSVTESAQRVFAAKWAHILES